ncbi:hypothetical protein [Zavarzinia sp.]|uniref:hypothetical protein n=1 Tax=Zavarzinia sp. TaxID=2027920 RepID=UPI00356A67F7
MISAEGSVSAPVSVPTTSVVTAIAAVRVSTSGVRTETAQAVAEAGPVYFSPHFSYDSDLGITIVQLRDSSTGKVENQFPSQQVVAEYRRAQAYSGGTARGGETGGQSGTRGTGGHGSATARTPAASSPYGSDSLEVQA